MEMCVVLDSLWRLKCILGNLILFVFLQLFLQSVSRIYQKMHLRGLQTVHKFLHVAALRRHSRRVSKQRSTITNTWIWEVQCWILRQLKISTFYIFYNFTIYKYHNIQHLMYTKFYVSCNFTICKYLNIQYLIYIKILCIL
jgi:hypothetical protein